MDPVHSYEAVNVEAQGRSAGSLLNWMKRLIAVRKAHRAFGRGTLEFLHPGNRKVIAYLREHEDEAILCVANLSRSAQPVELDLSRFRGLVPVELLGNSNFPPLGDLPYFLTLPGYGFYWFRLAREAAAPRWHQESPSYADPPVLVLPAGRQTARSVDRVPLRLPARQISQLEREALLNFLGTRRWFAAKGGGIERVEVMAQAAFGDKVLLTLLRVHVGDEASVGAEPQLYFLPLSAAWEEDTEEDGVSVYMPDVLTKLRRRARVGVLLDALSDEAFCRSVVAAMGENTGVSIGEGEIHFSGTDVFGKLVGDVPVGELSVRRADVEQTNSSVILGERLILKAYRRLQKGMNPDLEIGRYLTEKARFENTPPLAGAIEYTGPDGETTTLGLLQGFVGNQGDGWSYVLDYLDRYLEDRLLTSWSPEGEDEAKEELAAEDAFYAGLVRTLGLRTGELHAAFAAPTDDEAFAPETATPEEVAGWVDSVLAEARSTLDLLKRRRSSLPDEAIPDADRLLASRQGLTGSIKSVARENFRVVKTRHHGDYHLGQVLVVGNDFQIIDFEGEPARPLAERRKKHSPLRDVAGMLRSFDYAIRSALMDLGAERADQLEGLEPWVRLWEERTRQAFLDGYREGVGDAASYPEDEEHARALIELFTLEKALYEIRYELDNRPDWVSIPIKSVLDLLEDGEESP
jgi:maltose alpha-D-glucosyltransferase/alpha-amylase